MAPSGTARANASTIAALARLAAQLDAQGARLDEISAKAGEARDGMIQIKTTLLEQNLGVRLQALDDRLDTATNALRQDFVAANDRMRREGGGVVDAINARIDGHEKRIDDLEAAEDRRGGTGTIVGWLTTHGLTMMIAAATAIATFLGLRTTHP